MLNNISWASYWTFIAVTLIPYYIYVGLLHYRKELQGLLRFQFNTPARASENSVITPATIHSLTADLKVFMHEAFISSADKDTLIFGLQNIIRKFGLADDGPSRSMIETFILSQCANNAAINLGAEDLKLLWVGAGSGDTLPSSPRKEGTGQGIFNN